MAYNYFQQKEENRTKAQVHTQWVDENLKPETQWTIENTIFINENSKLSIADETNANRAFKTFPNVHCIGTDTVSAIFNYYDVNGRPNEKVNSGMLTVLNFASFKNPGGMFIEGSSAQEEALCHESNLFNVLVGVEDQRNNFYYAENRKKTNYALYYNRALLSPMVVFSKDPHFENSVHANVITCAAPNVKAFFKYHGNTNNKADQYNAFNTLEDRIKFVIRIAAEYGCENLILGAFGCGVFGNDPQLVAKCFLDAIDEYSNSFKNIIFAVPNGFNNNNYEVFASMVFQWNLAHSDGVLK